MLSHGDGAVRKNQKIKNNVKEINVKKAAGGRTLYSRMLGERKSEEQKAYIIFRISSFNRRPLGAPFYHLLIDALRGPLYIIFY